MSSYKIENLNLTFTNEDKLQAAKIRAANLARFTNEPTSWNARRTLDRAEAIAPAPAEASGSGSGSGVQQAGREAMSALKAALSSIRSKQSSGQSAQWNESVPPTTEETKIAATIAVDKVNDEVSASQVKTAVTLNIRPLNKQAFEIARASVCKERGIPLDAAPTADASEENDSDSSNKNPEAIVTIKSKIKAGVSSSESAKLVEICNSFFTTNLEDSEDSKVFARIENIDGSDYFVWNFVNLDKSEDDPLEKFLERFADRVLDGVDSEHFKAQAPGIFRLITAKAELPHSLAEWLEKGDKSWTSLVEASRVSVEAILRRDIHAPFHEVLAKGLLNSFDKEELVPLLVAPLLHGMAQGNSLNVSLAPTELLYAFIVREASFFNRRLRETQDVPSKARRVTEEASRKYAEWFDTDAPECLTAYHVGSTIFAGTTGNVLRTLLVQSVAKAAIEAQEDEDEDSAVGIHFFLQLAKVIGEVKSVNILAHSFSVTADFEGVDSNIWNVLPYGSIDALIDAARPLGLANKEEFDLADPTKDFEDDDDKTLKKRNLKSSEYWPQGAYEEAAEAATDTFAPNGYLDTDSPLLIISKPQKRNKAFRIAIAVNSEDKTKSWARLLTALGAEVFDPSAANGKKGKKSDDSDASDDDDSDDEDGGSMLPDPTEGYMRVAYIRNSAAAGGRNIELVRAVSTEEYSDGLLATADGIIVVDAVEDIEFLKSALQTIGEDQNEDQAAKAVKSPIVYVSTKSDVANADTNGTLNPSVFTPSAVDYRVLGTESYSAGSAASAILNFLINNSANRERGVQNAAPASAWDFDYDARITIP